MQQDYHKELYRLRKSPNDRIYLLVLRMIEQTNFRETLNISYRLPNPLRCQNRRVGDFSYVIQSSLVDQGSEVSTR